MTNWANALVAAAGIRRGRRGWERHEAALAAFWVVRRLVWPAMALQGRPAWGTATRWVSTMPSDAPPLV